MEYVTYYEERNTITVGKYQQIRQNLLSGEQQCSLEKNTLRKLKFIGNESQAAHADYALCIKNGDDEQIYLEKKYIQNGLHFKSTLKLSREECQQILDGDLDWMKDHKKDLLSDFYRQITLNHLCPGYMTEYERETAHRKKGECLIFCRKISRAVGITNRLFDEPKMAFQCLDEGKILVTYKKEVKLPKIFGGLFTGQEEQPPEAARLTI